MTISAACWYAAAAGGGWPQVRRIDTANAASSRHMILINEVLGFRVHGSGKVTDDKTISPERIPARA
jgi:hypothetical protein